MELSILTPSGFQPFEDIARYWHDTSLKFIFNDKSVVECALDHRFIINDKEVYARDVLIGDDIGKIVSHISKINEGDYFYDPVNVGNGSVYDHDQSFVSHNTFHGTGNTLISGDTLLGLQAQNPIFTQNNVKVYVKPEEHHDYMVFVDVAKGRGMDSSTFNIIDVTTKPFQQVAVFKDNMISPLLFPDIIYKYAKTYNDAYVIIESNDQGAVVCNGLYYDLEYENVFVESMIKANSIGVTMTRKVKRIGCSNIKDLVEQSQLSIVDQDTIIEMSTFVASGSSYEASTGNHDDLMMNLVLFGWFAATPFFGEMTDIDMKSMMYAEQQRMIENDVVPFGVYDNGIIEEVESIREGGDTWFVQKDVFF